MGSLREDKLSWLESLKAKNLLVIPYDRGMIMTQQEVTPPFSFSQPNAKKHFTAIDYVLVYLVFGGMHKTYLVRIALQIEILPIHEARALSSPSRQRRQVVVGC